MRYVGKKKALLAKLRTPKDHEIDQEHVAVLAKDMRERGQLTPIGVTRKNVILWGHHRIAALKMNRETFARAEIWECANARDAEAASLAEQVRRRRLSPSAEAQAMASLVAYQEGIVGAGADNSEARGPGRPKAAVAKVADDTGVPVRTVREQAKIGGSFTPPELAALDAAGIAHKARLKLAMAIVPMSALARATAIREAIGAATKQRDGEVVDEFGNTLPVDVAASYRAAQALCDDVGQKLTDARSAFTRHKTAILAQLNGQAPAILAQLGVGHYVDREVAQAATACRQARPHALCPSCKAEPARGSWPGRAECQACRGLGWVGAGAAEKTEDALLVYGRQAHVVHSGRIVPLPKAE